MPINSSKNAAPVVITPEHRIMFDQAVNGTKAVEAAKVRLRDAMHEMLASLYGDETPTYEQFRADHKALAALAKEKGLADNQWVRKPYNAAVKALYGALPVSMSAAAIAKRVARPGALGRGTATPEPGKGGAPAGETGERNPSAQELIEQAVAKIGILPTIEALTRILQVERATAQQAAKLSDVAHELRTLGSTPARLAA